MFIKSRIKQDTNLDVSFFLTFLVKLICLYPCVINKCELKSLLCITFTKFLESFITIWYGDNCAKKCLKKMEITCFIKIIVFQIYELIWKVLKFISNYSNSWDTRKDLFVNIFIILSQYVISKGVGQNVKEKNLRNQPGNHPPLTTKSVFEMTIHLI